MFRARSLETLLLAAILAGAAPGCSDEGGGGSGPTTAATAVTTATTAAQTSGTGTASESDGSSAGTGSDVTATTGVDPTTGALSTTTTTTWPFTTGSESDSGWWMTTADGDRCKVNIDIVFVMDVSTSMAWILQKLADEILIVDQAAQMLDIETEVHYGLVVFVDDAKIINNGMPYADAAALQADFIEWSNFTQSNSQTSGQGFNGDWPENTLDALYTAAFGFQWRPIESTLRMIIHTTDDTFGDKGAVQSGVTVQHSYDETVLALQERQIRVFAFADNDKTGGPNNNQDVSMGFFTPYNGKTPIPEATDGGAFNLGDVYSGKLSLSAAINESVEASLCSVYIPK
ncbi:MAG TPA: vWA domain-containing protein [Nannocystis sp.]